MLQRAILLLGVGLAGGALLASALPVVAQTFPVPGKPIRIVVPFPPGGQTDVYARVVAQHLGEALGGTPVVVENKPGDNTMLGAADIARAG